MVYLDNLFLEIDARKAIEKDGIMITNSAIPHNNRDEFYLRINEDEFENYIRRTLNIRKIDYLIEYDIILLVKGNL